MTTDHFINTELLKLEGWCLQDKARVLVSMIQKYKPRIVVEIGVFGGRSLIPMALAMRDLGGGRLCYGIDPWTVEAALEGDIGAEHREWWTKNVKLGEVYQTFMDHVDRLELGDTIRVMRRRGDHVVRLFPKASIPFIHLDSNHSEQVSCRDVTMWVERLAPGGVWVMDDTDWPSMQKAVGMVDAMGFDLLVNGGTYRVYRSNV